MLDQQHRARIEYKYYLPVDVRSYFLADLRPFTRQDSHALAKGHYPIASIYFDTVELNAYHDKLAGALDRFKCRLRFYPPLEENSYVKAELKYKISDKIVKDASRVSYQGFLDLLQSRSRRHAGDCPVMRRIHHLIQTYKFYPFMRIDYNRKAFFGSTDSGVRITIDSNIFCNRFSGNPTMQPHIPVLPPGLDVLEIKSRGYLPVWLTYLIKKYSLTRSAISKYSLGAQNLARNSSFFLK